LSQAEELRGRTKKFAIRIVRLFKALPRATEAQVMGKQLLRCGTSVAANYRAVCRARSKAEFIARIGVVAEEADESVFWIELLEETKILSPKQLEGILMEARELAAIFSASQKTAKDQR
jgi:four helix bundle protein